MKISKEQLSKLNNFVGSGDFINANIIFFGNEEGLGSLELKEAIKRRCNLHDKEDTPRLSNNIFYRKNWEIEEKAVNSSMLQFQSRILLFLNNQNGNWFLKKDEEPILFQQIKEYQRAQLYRESISYKFKSALIDLRPLPRFTEKEWPYANINRSEYLKAFQFKRENGIAEDLLKLKNQRAQNIKTVFDSSKKAKVIVGIGDKHSKRNLFEQLYNAYFTNIIEGKCFQSQIKHNGKALNIILSNFFDYRSLGLENLKELSQIIRKCIEGD